MRKDDIFMKFKSDSLHFEINSSGYKAHVFICMLAYYLLWHMNSHLKELYLEDAKKYTHSHVIEVLKSQRKFVMIVGGTGIQSHVIATPTQLQEKIQNMVLGFKVA